MSRPGDLDGFLSETGANAVIGWLLAAVLWLTAVATFLEGRYDWTVLTVVLVALVVVPAIQFRDLRVMPPWELVALVAAPGVWQGLFGQTFATELVTYLAVAALALVIAVQLHMFTAVRMNHAFAISLVVLTTLAVAGLWNVLQWGADVLFGTSYVLDGRSADAVNATVMLEFASAGIAGVGGGLVFDLYFRSHARGPGNRTAVAPNRETDRKRSSPRGNRVSLRSRLGMSPDRQYRLSRAMQLVLVATLLWGFYVRDLPTIGNAAIALAITFVPAAFEHEYDLEMDAGLVLWITTAVFLHALGSAGLYDAIDPWDHFTHALSASVVAAAGYAVFRAIDLHTDRIYIPKNVMAVLIFVFVLAAAVVWELVEFVIDQTAIVLELDAVLAQHGIHDTMIDLVFNLIGAVIVTVWGAAYLTDVSESLADRLDHRFGAE